MSRANYRGDVVDLAYEIVDLEPEALARLREILRRSLKLVDYRGLPLAETAAEELRDLAREAEALVGSSDLEGLASAFSHATGIRP